jgi:hypothetical protein
MEFLKELRLILQAIAKITEMLFGTPWPAIMFAAACWLLL